LKPVVSGAVTSSAIQEAQNMPVATALDIVEPDSSDDDSSSDGPDTEASQSSASDSESPAPSQTYSEASLNAQARAELATFYGVPESEVPTVSLGVLGQSHPIAWGTHQSCRSRNPTRDPGQHEVGSDGWFEHVYEPEYPYRIVTHPDDMAFGVNPLEGGTIEHRGTQFHYRTPARVTPINQDLRSRTRYVYITKDRDASQPLLWNEIAHGDGEMWKSLEYEGDLGETSFALPSQIESILKNLLVYAGVASPMLAVCARSKTGKVAAAAIGMAAFAIERYLPQFYTSHEDKPYYAGYQGSYFVHIVDIEREIPSAINDDVRLPHQKTVSLRAGGLRSRLIHHMAEINPQRFNAMEEEDRTFARVFRKMSDCEIDHQKVADCYYEGSPDLKRCVDISTQKSSANHTINVPWRSKGAQLTEQLYYKARFNYNFSNLSDRPLN